MFFWNLQHGHIAFGALPELFQLMQGIKIVLVDWGLPFVAVVFPSRLYLVVDGVQDRGRYLLLFLSAIF